MKRGAALYGTAVLLLCIVFVLVPFIEYPSLEPIEITYPVKSAETTDLTSKQSFTAGDAININTATIDELILLPGIGETKAQAIITYREENGGFTSVDELTRVKGIGEKTLQKLKPLVCI